MNGLGVDADGVQQVVRDELEMSARDATVLGDIWVTQCFEETGRRLVLGASIHQSQLKARQRWDAFGVKLNRHVRDSPGLRKLCARLAGFETGILLEQTRTGEWRARMHVPK